MKYYHDGEYGVHYYESLNGGGYYTRYCTVTNCFSEYIHNKKFTSNVMDEIDEIDKIDEINEIDEMNIVLVTENPLLKQTQYSTEINEKKMEIDDMINNNLVTNQETKNKRKIDELDFCDTNPNKKAKIHDYEMPNVGDNLNKISINQLSDISITKL